VQAHRKQASAIVGVPALRNTNIGGGKRNVRAGTAGAVEAVVAAMRAHASDASVQARACEP
jgi:hypothetical protein